MTFRMFRPPLAAFAALVLVSACDAAPRPGGDPPAAGSVGAEARLVRKSSPSDGATLSGAPENLVLTFAKPARLHEVVVKGSDGSEMPTMVTAAGEVSEFKVPLPALEPGSYVVTWRATSGGSSHQGSIRFTIR